MDRLDKRIERAPDREAGRAEGSDSGGGRGREVLMNEDSDAGLYVLSFVYD